MAGSLRNPDGPVARSSHRPVNRASRSARPGRELCRQLRRQLLRAARSATAACPGRPPGPRDDAASRPDPDRLERLLGHELRAPGRLHAGRRHDARHVRLPRHAEPPDIAGITDGTSNTIIVGEVVPEPRGRQQLLVFNGAYAGTTVPLGWNSNTYPGHGADLQLASGRTPPPRTAAALGRRQGIRQPASRAARTCCSATAR